MTIALPRQKQHSDWLARLRTIMVLRPGQRVVNVPGIGVSASRRAVASGNGLLNALIAYWPGDEANGNLQDAHTNALHLTDNNTVTNATGLVYATARQYTAANSEHHKRAGDDALLSVGDLDFTLATWVNFDTVGTTSKWIASKRSTLGSVAGYQQFYFGSDIAGPNRMAFTVLVGGVATTLSASTFGALSTGQWYHVVSWHDAVANQIGIAVNGVSDTVAYTAGAGYDNERFIVGALWVGSALYCMNGRIGPVAFWKSAAGGGGVLSLAQRTALYNAGNGLPYASFTA